MATVLGNAVEFLQKIGVFEVVLPFLLTFTMVFAILERSKVFGTEKIGGEFYTRKNLNAMAAFAIALIVVGSGRIVEAILSISAQMVILLFLMVFLVLLLGSFMKEGVLLSEGVTGKTQTFFIILVILGIMLILFNTIKIGTNTLLEILIGFLLSAWNSAAVASIILIGIIILFMYLITRSS